MFQHTAARRRLEFQTAYQTKRSKFQHTAARRRLVENQSNTQPMKVFQHTAARRRLVTANGSGIARLIVSTHSRPKAAGLSLNSILFTKGCFNTQPPEGGWLRCTNPLCGWTGFNTQPPEGGWRLSGCHYSTITRFQHTAARRRLAEPER